MKSILRYVNSKNTEISLKSIDFIDKIKLILEKKLDNTTDQKTEQKKLLRNPELS